MTGTAGMLFVCMFNAVCCVLLADNIRIKYAAIEGGREKKERKPRRQRNEQSKPFNEYVVCLQFVSLN